MSTKKALSLKKGDIILVSNCIIGVIRYIGYVNGLSNGKYDHYIGIESKYKCDNQTIGIVTDGKFSGHIYFNSSQDVGRFIKEQMVSKKFSPEELFDTIPNPKALITDSNDSYNTILSKPISQPKPKPPPKIQSKIQPSPKPEEKIQPKTKATPTISYDTDVDIGIIAKRVHTFCSSKEIEYLIKFCKAEGFTEIDNIEDDLEVFGDDDSAIIVAMKKQFAWNHNKVTKFVSLALDRKSICTPSSTAVTAVTAQNNQTIKPNIPSTRYRLDTDEKKERSRFIQPIQHVSDVTTQYKLPKIREFTVPTSIMKQRDPRSINDIVLCFKKNKISHAAVIKFKQFCNTEHYKFIDLENNLTEVRNKFKSRHGDLIVFMDYIDKCIYELSPPLFKAGKFTKKDEDTKFAYFQKQCKGVIKHDRDLLQYFCITEHTEKELPSELIDIADRIAIEQKQEFNRTQFAKKYFFKHCSKQQISKVKEGLRKYHNRFMPLFPKNPVKLVADKISGYQKYCILLSQIVTEIEQQICSGYNQYNQNNALLIPYMIDMMIIPPGCFNKIEDVNTKAYDSSGPVKIGDIKTRLNAFNIEINETRGLTDKTNNFDSAITQRITKKIIEYIRKITDNFGKKNQRICILVDRRWRINCKKFDAFNKLRKYSAGVHVSGDESGAMNENDAEFEGSSSKHKKSASWITKGLFGGGSGGYDDNNNKGKKTKNTGFYNNKYDTIYVYQTNLSASSGKRTSYHEFKNDYCHESLIYLTKQCIIPIKDHYMHIGGDSTKGWLFNISAHIQIPQNQLWYKYDQRWYIFLQSAALRFFPGDMHNLWSKYFIDASEDTDRLTLDQIKRMFRINLEETDSSYKRWYYAIKRTD